MTRNELVSALQSTESHIIQAKRQRRDAVKAGINGEDLENIDLALDDLRDQCRGYRKAIKVKDGMMGMRRGG